MGRGRKRHRRSPTAQSLEAPQFKPQTVPDKKKDYKPELVIPVQANKLELVSVPPHEVEAIWPLAEMLLSHELPHIDWTPEQLRDACIAAETILWMVCDENDDALAAMVTILTVQRRCIVVICSGTNLFDFIGARHQLYDWAKEQGMREVTFFGRDALVKLMPECKRDGVILRKEL